MTHVTVTGTAAELRRRRRRKQLAAAMALGLISRRSREHSTDDDGARADATGPWRDAADPVDRQQGADRGRDR